MDGIFLLNSDGNSLSGNTATGNVNGTNLIASNNNIITGNLLYGNEYCMNETNSVGNVYADNACTAPPSVALPLDPFILGLIIGLAAGLGVLAVILIINLTRGRKK